MLVLGLPIYLCLQGLLYVINVICYSFCLAAEASSISLRQPECPILDDHTVAFWCLGIQMLKLEASKQSLLCIFQVTPQRSFDGPQGLLLDFERQRMAEMEQQLVLLVTLPVCTPMSFVVVLALLLRSS